MTFATLLTTYRTAAKLSKVDLALAIEKTDGYIRKLELGYTPPTFPICQKLASKLALTTQETLQLYTAAVFERIGDDAEFFSKIEKLKPKVSHKIKKKEPTHHPIQYCIDLSFKSKLITPTISDHFLKYITQFIRETGSILLEEHLAKATLRLLVATPDNIAIATWTNELKSTVSRQLKNQFPKHIGDGLILWTPGVNIVTIGTQSPIIEEQATWTKTQKTLLQKQN